MVIVLGVRKDKYVREAGDCNYNDKDTKECGMVMLLRKTAGYSETKERKSYDEKEGSVVGRTVQTPTEWGSRKIIALRY